VVFSEYGPQGGVLGFWWVSRWDTEQLCGGVGLPQSGFGALLQNGFCVGVGKHAVDVT
jgi:hypothetical protein